jgi:hypothetical protein
MLKLRMYGLRMIHDVDTPGLEIVRISHGKFSVTHEHATVYEVQVSR